MAPISRKHPMLRRSQAMWVSRRVWQPRLPLVMTPLGFVLCNGAHPNSHRFQDIGVWKSASLGCAPCFLSHFLDAEKVRSAT
ncbi:hypothetical protein FJV76_27675 [Mesorhizobium sp. WSM4303]|nr:hypothetical protein FJV77_28745 [Mesorhizobium sp. WSM4306]TRC97220.1 hypothetical protein FJV76_27675 [Mesorhizobium sp. WSM4303]